MLATVCKKTICVSLSALLAVFGFVWAHSSEHLAFAETVEEAESAVANSESVLDNAKSRLDAISNEYDELSSEIATMQADIDKLAEQVLAAQSAMLDGRKALSNTAVHEYRNSPIDTFLEIIFGSTDIVTLSRNMDYMTQIMSSQAQDVAAQKELRAQFLAASEKLTSQKDKQENKLSELSQKRKEAQSVVEQAASQVTENTERLDKLREQAQSFIWGQVEPESKAEAEEKEEKAKKGEMADTSESDLSGGGWQSGSASAYGGVSDTITGCPASTATGAVCDDWSLGVAIPMSWSNFRSYYGRTIEISYGGRSVYATINDCGGFGAYGRALDLQPGVFKALLGNDKAVCATWGVRTVSYRIL